MILEKYSLNPPWRSSCETVHVAVMDLPLRIACIEKAESHGFTVVDVFSIGGSVESHLLEEIFRIAMETSQKIIMSCKLNGTSK